MNIGIYIYENAEVLDFSGPFEVFSTASRVCKNDSPFSCYLISENSENVKARGGFNVIPSFSIFESPKLDVILISGGVHNQELKKNNVLKWIKEKSDEAVAIASVCTGVFLLAEAGVVKNHKVTTHWEDIAELKTNYPNLKVVESERWVRDDNIISSAGISAGIDMSLYLVEILYSKMLAEKTAFQMEYDWRKI